ncbi:MAG TPA: DUF6498-containing protein [Thermoanaerobaculia bacterium]|nr:DUF6498-containing protein [Thermoanaerobaculia bacterium]HUM30422.1 DUF6498-containing protein [Thermoanaerobaculia bacterium]HXK68567.1 DUF6498-containing protein [Thermoanaerobaculia bacterium]
MKAHSYSLDVLLFVATVSLAVVNHWEVTDLVWSLWISSLTLGYSFLMVPIASMILRGDPGTMIGPGKSPKVPAGAPRAIQALPMNIFVLFVAIFMIGFHMITFWIVLLVGLSTLLGIGGMLRDRPAWSWCPDPGALIPRTLIVLPFALFLFGFFTIHFVGFHFVHGIFLNGFFPILQESPFGKTIEGTFEHFLSLVQISFLRYWPFVAFSALSRIPDYIRAWNHEGGNFMFKPYINVVRMHIMIFVFAFAAAAGLKDALLYPLLVVYFFPWGVLWRSRKDKVQQSQPPES